jgi:hypothetical protein
VQGPNAVLNVITVPPGATQAQARVVIDGVRGAIFVYANGGQLVGSWAGSAGTDPYGNAYPEGFYGLLGVIQGPIITVGDPGNNQIVLNPLVSSAFNITTAIAGILQAAMQLETTDSNEVLPGNIGSIILGTGTSAKMATLITSPFGNTGAAIVLESENDGGTDTAVITFGTVTTPDSSTLIFTPIFTVSPYAFLLYGTSSSTTVVTKTSGSGNIPIPAGVTTAIAECWGAASGGSNAVTGNAGGGGEYAAEPNLAVPGGGNVPYSVGAGGTGGASSGSSVSHLGTAGGDSTLTGSSITVTAHGGTAPTSTQFGGGGTGSTNTTHNDGGEGGESIGYGGGGGGGSAGPNNAGNAGTPDNGNTGGAGGAAVTGGGAGGAGGNGGSSATAGHAGSAPGGAGGGGGFNTSTSLANAGGNGANGQVRLTYQTPGSNPVIMLSIAAAAGTDQFGTAYPAGVNVLNFQGASGEYAHGQIFSNATRQLELSAPMVNSTDNQSVLNLISEATNIPRITTNGGCTFTDIGSTPTGTPGNGAMAYSSSGHLKYVSNSAGDGNAYNTGRFTQWLTASQNITSSTLTTVLSAPVVAGTYRIKALFYCKTGGGSAPSTLGVSGPATSLVMIEAINHQISSNSSSAESSYPTVFAAMGNSGTSVSYASSSYFVWEVEGIVTFTASGTFAIQAANNGSNNWSVQPGSFMELLPVT